MLGPSFDPTHRVVGELAQGVGIVKAKRSE